MSGGNSDDGGFISPVCANNDKKNLANTFPITNGF